MLDLSKLITSVARCDTLSTSITTMLRGLADIVLTSPAPAELAAALVFVPPPNDTDISLGAALTIGTSHIAVHPRDPLVDTLRVALEMPTDNRDAHIAAIKFALEQPQLDIASQLVAVQKQLDEANATLASATPATRAV